MTEEQRKNITTISILVVLLLNFSAFIWGAAVMSTSVDQLNVTTVGIQSTITEVNRMLTNHEARIAVVEDRTKEL